MFIILYKLSLCKNLQLKNHATIIIRQIDEMNLINIDAIAKTIIEQLRLAYKLLLKTNAILIKIEQKDKSNSGILTDLNPNTP